jgi:branched-chain amino acid transport system substrate-binding protein
MPGIVAYETEGATYASHILRTKPDGKIAILAQNDDFGRDYVAGFKRGLGSKAAAMIVAETTYENGAPTINSQIAALKASGANILFGVTVGKFTSQLIRGLADIGWKPALIYVPTSSSSLAILEPAGLENATGVFTSAFQKDINDDQWSDDDDTKEYFAFMKQFMPNSDARNATYSFGYLYGHLLVQILKACGDDVSRENILRQATSLQKLKLPLLLPGVSLSTGRDDYLPIKQLQMRRFNGKSWVGIGDLIEER